MRTTFVTGPPPIVEDWLAQRRALGQDLYDEVWEGEYRVAPAGSLRHADVQGQLIEILGPIGRRAGLHRVGPSNIGQASDYRVPDLAFLRRRGVSVRASTAAIVVEVASTHDESRTKLPFYFRIGVEEVLIVDPDGQTVEWFARGADGFETTDGSALLGLTSAELADALDWP